MDRKSEVRPPFAVVRAAIDALRFVMHTPKEPAIMSNVPDQPDASTNPHDTSALEGDAAIFVANRKVGMLATGDANGQPSAIPVCYDWDGAELWIALDAKPKRFADPLRLQRVRNILARPEVTMVVQDYLDDWSQLAYVLIRGSARIVPPDDPAHAPAVARLRAKYPHYLRMPIATTPAIAIRPSHVVRWGALQARANRPADFESAIIGRRSVRRFAPTPVGREQIERIVAAAGYAPSPHGSQPWRFAVLSRDTTKEALAEAMGADWVATLAQDGEPAAVVAARLTSSRERIRGAPAIIVPCLYLRISITIPMLRASRPRQRWRCRVWGRQFRICC